MAEVFSPSRSLTAKAMALPSRLTLWQAWQENALAADLPQMKRTASRAPKLARLMLQSAAAQ